MAEEYGLSVEYKAEFHQVFEEHRDHSEFAPLMVRMKVVDSNGESAMDEDQWEAASAKEPHCSLFSADSIFRSVHRFCV